MRTCRKKGGPRQIAITKNYKARLCQILTAVGSRFFMHLCQIHPNPYKSSIFMYCIFRFCKFASCIFSICKLVLRFYRATACNAMHPNTRITLCCTGIVIIAIIVTVTVTHNKWAALVLGNTREYCHKLYIARNVILWLHFRRSLCLSSTTLT